MQESWLCPRGGQKSCVPGPSDRRPSIVTALRAKSRILSAPGSSGFALQPEVAVRRLTRLYDMSGNSHAAERRDPGRGAATAPLVSVVIPTYNRAQLVSESIESVLAQT